MLLARGSWGAGVAPRLETRSAGWASTSPLRRIFVLPHVGEAKESSGRQPVPVGVRHGLHPVTQSELEKDVRHVGLDRGAADEELGGDLLVGQSLCEQPEHL